MIGHDVQHDFKVLLLNHPPSLIRDTARFYKFRINGRPRALRTLCRDILEVQIQAKDHSPVEDARAALLLYRHVRKEWENNLKAKLLPNKSSKVKKRKKPKSDAPKEEKKKVSFTE